MHQPVRLYSLLWIQTPVTKMKMGFHEKGNKYDITENQLSQDWAAREHKWRPISPHTQIMIAPGRAHSAEGLGAHLGGVLQVPAISQATPQGWFLLLCAVPPTRLFCLDSFHNFSAGCPKDLLTSPLVDLDSAAAAFDVWRVPLCPQLSWPAEGQISADSPHMLVPRLPSV